MKFIIMKLCQRISAFLHKALDLERNIAPLPCLLYEIIFSFPDAQKYAKKKRSCKWLQTGLSVIGRKVSKFASSSAFHRFPIYVHQTISRI